MFRNLIPFLTDRFYIIAPDYPGFGNSSMPVPDEFTYTFHNISIVIEKLLDLLGIRQSVFYVQDYGGPVVFRIAVRQPFDLFKSLWKDRNLTLRKQWEPCPPLISQRSSIIPVLAPWI
ncbi:alpha/beta fold hydrolase [Neobacillus cucumis]|uniref:alpha/beta fold hydrolase n=1 Tax=Neobacillus cucumis TaxID=1740721 RepID=UPI001E307870|nr:alpha/beta fold hydrolase [Neobacillus cucumis]